MKILVVDDEPALRLIVSRHLTRAGHEVIEAEDGLNAWEVFQRDPVPMVITDWMMPLLSGPDLIRKIRSANLANYTYIIILTAVEKQQNVMTVQQAGADDYLTKPIDREELLARIAFGERILRLEAKRRADRRQPEDPRPGGAEGGADKSAS